MPPVSLPAVATPALLTSIRAHPHLPQHTWYFIAGVTLSVINRPDEIPKVFKYAINNGAGSMDTKPQHDEQLLIARKLREALVKAAPIGGLPKVQSTILRVRIEISRLWSISYGIELMELWIGDQCPLLSQIRNSALSTR